MSVIGDLIEDEATDRIADLAVHVANLRVENEELRLQRDRYRKESEYYRLKRRMTHVGSDSPAIDQRDAGRMCDTNLTGAAA